MPNYIEIPLEGFSKGIWLLWKHSIDFNLEIISPNISFFSLSNDRQYKYGFLTWHLYLWISSPAFKKALLETNF